MQWDTAAGEAVLRGAGGLVARLDGVPLVYGGAASVEGFSNPGFVAWGDPALARASAG
jgi:3'-phosphoadenosine 5'-phosphosulfate (PAPS) 3'-phosphatase